MKKYLLTIIIIIIGASLILVFSERGSGFLNRDFENGGVKIYYGTQSISGRVHVWTDKKHAELYSDPQKSLIDGYVKNFSVLHYTGKQANGLYEAVVKIDLKSGMLSGNRSDSTKEYGRKYYEQCSTCHGAAEPNRYTRHRWEGILKSMQQHAGISDEDLSVIDRYILLNISN